MKKIILINTLSLTLTFVFGTNFLCAQDNNALTKTLYQSYFGNDSTNINILHIPCESADLNYVLSGVIYNRDTITINGKHYYFRVPQPLGNISVPADHLLFPRIDTLFLREERETGRLFRYYRNYFGTGETEKMICDMTLEVGDKFIVPNNYCLDEREYDVTSVYYDNDLKTIVLSGIWSSRVFQEGLFPSEYPLWQEPLPDIGGYEHGSADEIELLCEYKDGVLVYGDADGCFPNTQDIKETDSHQVSVYPTVIQSNNVITIESSEVIHSTVIIDIFGQTQEITPNQIDYYNWQVRLNCEQGIYFVIVKNDRNVSYEKVTVFK